MIGDRCDHRSVKTCIYQIYYFVGRGEEKKGRKKEGKEGRKRPGSIARARKNGRFDLFFVSNVRAIARS